MEKNSVEFADLGPVEAIDAVVTDWRYSIEHANRTGEVLSLSNLAKMDALANELNRLFWSRWKDISVIPSW